MAKKSSGKKFETTIEKLFLKLPDFNDDVFNGGFINVFNYNDYIGYGQDFESKIRNDDRNLFLFKNFPVNNNIDERTEFCVVMKTGDEIIKWRIECKFQDVGGSTNKKIEHEFEQYRRFKNINSESYFVLVYDGRFYDEKQKIVADVLDGIRYDYDILFLNLTEFKNFIDDCFKDNISEVVKTYHEKLYE